MEKIEPMLSVGRECYLRVEDRVYFVEILGVAKDSLWMTFPGPDYLEEGTGCELEFSDGEGYICYHTRVAVSPANPGDPMILARSEAANRSLRRCSWRVPADMPVQLKILDRGANHDGALENISAEGALIVTSVPCSVGTKLGIVLNLPGQTPLKLTARIAHAAQENNRYRYGLKYDRVPRHTRRALTWFLWKRIREIYPDDLRALYPSSHKK